MGGSHVPQPGPLLFGGHRLSFHGVLIFLCLLHLVAPQAESCSRPLGMEEGRIPDHAITASSSYELKSVGPQNGRIRQELNGGAWCPKAQISSEVREYLEVELGREYLITRTETQGRFGNGQGQEYAEAFLIEYWRASLGEWVIYKDSTGQKILSGNTNTYLVVSQELELPFVASRVRFIPYSEHPRTVCMRVELHGCLWDQGLSSYTAPRGDSELEDLSYDGRQTHGLMVGGLGQLTDGLFGPPDFLQEVRDKSTGSRWVGWTKESQKRDILELTFNFAEVRRFSSLRLHTSHIPTRDVQVFSEALVWLSPDGQEYPVEPAATSYSPAAELLATSSDGTSGVGPDLNVSLPLGGRTGLSVRLQLRFAARWILLSEISFQSGPVLGNMTEEEAPEVEPAPEENEVERRPPSTTHARKELTPATTASGRTQAYIGLVTGLLAVVVLMLGCTVLLMVRRGRKKVALLHKHASLGTKPGVTINMKELKMSTPIMSKAGGLGKGGGSSGGGGATGGGGGKLYLPGEESEDSENSSVYHEPYKLLPSTKTEYGSLLKKEALLPQSKSAEYSTGLCRSLDFSAVGFGDDVKFSSPSLYNLSPPPPQPPPPPGGNGGGGGSSSSSGVGTTGGHLHGRPPPSYEMSTAFSTLKPLTENYYAATDIIKTERREQHLTPGKFTPLKLPDGSPEETPNILEVSRHRLRVIEKLGEGSFGMIHLCETEGVPEYNGMTSYHKRQVIVKSIWRGSSESTKKEFARESSWMATLRDLNVTRVMGVCSGEEPFCLLQEYCEFGDLPTFLQLQASSPDQENPALSYGCLIYMATQIASGMKYLESLDIPHRDLAARNCLVGKSYQIKVSEHAMYCSKYEADYYLSDTKAKLPIRWMAWESLLLGKQTTKSDVWSFGVTLWELLTVCGQKPFGELTPEQVIENCSRWYEGSGGERVLGRPAACPREIYDLMTECWRRAADDRPRFSEIHLFLQRKNLGYVPSLA